MVLNAIFTEIMDVRKRRSRDKSSREFSESLGGLENDAGHPAEDVRIKMYSKSAKLILLILVEAGWTVDMIDESLPFGLSVPIRETLHHLKNHPPPGWSTPCYLQEAHVSRYRGDNRGIQTDRSGGYHLEQRNDETKVGRSRQAAQAETRR